jgi:hypothetical protein
MLRGVLIHYFTFVGRASMRRLRGKIFIVVIGKKIIGDEIWQARVGS